MADNNIGKLERLNSFINNSATISEFAGADIAEPAHKAVMYDTDGNVVLATSGDKAIGLILSSVIDPIKKGGQVSVLIKYIGLLEAGSAIGKGDFVTINSSGQGVKASGGAFIFGRAFTSAAVAGETVQVQINPMGSL